MGSKKASIVWVTSLLALALVKSTVLDPMLQDLTGAGTADGGLATEGVAGSTETASGFNETASVDVPGVGSINFADPLTLAGAASAILLILGAAAVAGGFLTSGKSGNTSAMIGWVGIFLGFGGLLLSNVYPLFAMVPHVGLAAFLIYGVGGLLYVMTAALDYLAGVSSA